MIKMNITLWGLVEVEYKVGSGGLGDYEEGSIVKAYKIPSEYGSSLIFHPQDNMVHYSCFDMCVYLPEENLYAPVNETCYINLPDNAFWYNIRSE